MIRKRTYGQFCPVAQAAEIVAERWTPLVLRELIAGSHRFSELKKGVPLMSPSLLSQRLKELEAAGVVQRVRPEGSKAYEYHLTEAGMALRPVIEGLGVWGHQWLQRELRREELDPALLMWDIHRRVATEKLPTQNRIVVQFDLNGVPLKKSRWWLVIHRGETDLCLKHPGHEVDLQVRAHIRALVGVWLGHVALQDALRSETVQLIGKRSIARSFKNWFLLSTFADEQAMA